MYSRIYAWFAGGSLVLLCLLGLAAFQDHNREWRHVQEEHNLRYPDRKPIETGKINQVVLTKMEGVDRCMTCHTTIQDQSMKGKGAPFGAHPGEFHKTHPFDEFGCVSCHGGQGLATTSQAAHGNVRFWEHPMMPKKFMEAKCGTCHTASVVEGAPKLTLGRKLFNERGCIGCHTLDGQGGNIGPELTEVGDKVASNEIWLEQVVGRLYEVRAEEAKKQVEALHAEHKHVSKELMAQANKRLTVKEIKQMTANDKLAIATEWLSLHFKDPQKYAPGGNTVMPPVAFTDEEAEALTTLMLSLNKERKHIPAGMLVGEGPKPAAQGGH